jgi:hypothetical protein
MIFNKNNLNYIKDNSNHEIIAYQINHYKLIKTNRVKFIKKKIKIILRKMNENLIIN